MNDTFIHRRTGELVEARRIETGIYTGHWKVIGVRWQCIVGPDLFEQTYERGE
jgi:hypothetical protein